MIVFKLELKLELETRDFLGLNSNSKLDVSDLKFRVFGHCRFQEKYTFSVWKKIERILLHLNVVATLFSERRKYGTWYYFTEILLTTVQLSSGLFLDTV